MDLLRTYRLVPLEEGEGYIKLLVPKDFDPLVLEEVRFSLGKEIIPVYVSEEEFSQRLQEVLAQEEPLVEVEGAEESEVRDILYEEETSQRIDETNKRIDQTRAELKEEIMQNTLRIDELNRRVDELYIQLSHIRGDLNRALSQKEVIEDVLTRVQRLELKVFGQL